MKVILCFSKNIKKVQVNPGLDVVAPITIGNAKS
jgi:hypothetical protein